MRRGCARPQQPDPRPRRPPVRGLSRVRVHAARPAGPAEDGLQPGRAGEPPPQVGGGRDQPVSPCPALASCRPYLACYTTDIPAYVSALSTPFKCPAHCFQTPSRWTLPCDPQPGPEDASPNPAVPTWDDKVQQAERKLREGGELLLFSGSGRSVGQGRSAWEGQSLGRAGCMAWARGIPPNRE